MSAAAGMTDTIAATVRTHGGEYPVVVAEGALARLGEHCRELGLAGRAFVVTDTIVERHLGASAVASLRAAGYAAETFAVPPGEQHKTLATVASIYDWLITAKVERRDFLVCLGGGVVTDMGGFAAATVLRGIDFVHVPTTSLGMLDAAIGGKTGVDHPLGKNLVGVFAQPRSVIIDPLVLATLPARELCAGWAELIKHGLILDEPLVRDLEEHFATPAAVMTAGLIGRSVAIKAAIVSEDEREGGRRTLLNYGHTIGHAIEAVTGYGEYLHGEAIAIGMRAAALISVEMGLLGPGDVGRQQRLLAAAGLPSSAPGLDPDAIIGATLRDKKVSAGSVRWVLLDGIGNATLRADVPEHVVRRAVEAVTS